MKIILLNIVILRLWGKTRTMSMVSGLASLLAIGLLSPVQSILWLIILFVSTAITLINTNYTLMGILYILIYVGAIAILFLFILSLLKIEYIKSNNREIFIIFLIIMLLVPVEYIDGGFSTIIIENKEIMNELSIVGEIFYTEYGVLLIIIGIILILSVVGAIGVTK